MKILRFAALLGMAAGSAAALFVAFGFSFPIKGPFIDRLASDVIARESGYPIHLFDVELSRWSQITFNLMNLSESGSERTLLASGRGAIHFQNRFIRKDRLIRNRFFLKDVAVMQELYQKSPLASWALKDAFGEPIFVTRLAAVVFKKQGVTRTHLLRLESEEIFLKGGFEMRGSEIVKAHFLLFLPNSRFEKVPKELRAMMMNKENHWKGIRIVLSREKLTVMGAAGPFFQAQWQAA